MVLGFPSRSKVPKHFNVGQLIADFGAAASAIAAVVNVERVIRTPLTEVEPLLVRPSVKVV